MDSSVPGGGAIMPQPDGISPKAIKEIQSALTTGKGAITLVETTGQGFGAGITARPSEDWTQKRFGPVIPEHNIALRDSSHNPYIGAMATPNLRPDGRCTWM